MPSVFVLMPFEKRFDAVYLDFIKNVLEEEGFEVRRADDIHSQQNILKDIIQSIRGANLIVADLTSSNPNVYYELGIAHALGRPVIHMVQSPIEDVPFDLRSYRLIAYSTHFTEIEKAKDELAKYARKFREGKLPFGNPVTDFDPVTDNLDSLNASASDVLNRSNANSRSGEKYELVRLGENGDWVWQTVEDPKLYICPNCYGKGKAEIPLQRAGVRPSDPAIQSQYKQYMCYSCNASFTTHPNSGYFNSP